MRVRFLCVTLVAVALLANSATLFAKSKPKPSDAWPVVQALPTGAKVIVKEKAGKTTKGQVTAITTDAITVSQRSGTVVIDKQQVARIHVDEQSLTRSTLIGLGVGAGTGAAVGGIMLISLGPEDAGDEAGLIMGVTTVLGAVGGAVGGTIRGLFPNRRLIYESR
jgi:hypothetical protein